VQRAFGVPEQAIMTMPILPGTDGERRMSKSLGNYVGVIDSPEDIYGKTLSIPDSALETWYSLLLGSEPPAELGPRDAKRALARALVERFWDSDAAIAAEASFDQVHVRGEVPDEVPFVDLTDPGPTVHLPALLQQAFGLSTSDARRALAQGGVKLDGEPVANGSLDVPVEEVAGKVLQLGKRRFARVRVTG
jgi:tyrosyl-tRNA synthetase